MRVMDGRVKMRLVIMPAAPATEEKQGKEQKWIWEESEGKGRKPNGVKQPARNKSKQRRRGERDSQGRQVLGLGAVKLAS